MHFVLFFPQESEGEPADAAGMLIYCERIKLIN